MMLFLILTSLLAFYVAWNLGANDVANSMGTSVGSKAVTFQQALMIAGGLEFAGAVLFGRNVSQTLATGLINPDLFSHNPHLLLMGMVSVLIACGVWLQIATSLSLPVASSHAVVGAIAGFAAIAAGVQAVDWPQIGIISLSWILTPILSGAIAAAFYTMLQRWILTHPHPRQQLNEWIPWLSTALFGSFGVLVLPSLSQPLQTWFQETLHQALPLHDFSLAIGVTATLTLTWLSWRWVKLDAQTEDFHPRQNPGDSFQSTVSATASKRQNSEVPADELANDADPAVTQRIIEKQLGRFQVLSACFVAFAHGSNDVGNAVAPLAAIAYIQRTDSVPQADFTVPLWILLVGGLGIVFGLSIWGRKVITTIGENITTLQPSGGFSAELATATTILIASRLGLPVSTSHALVGAVVGIGLVQGIRQGQATSALKLDTLQQIALAWVVTIPIAALLSAGLFTLSQLIFQK